MRVSLMIDGQDGVTWERWLQLARAAEDNGLEGLFCSDHYLALRGDPREGSLDVWSVLAALAARTERIRLGTMVSPVTFRPASVLAKCAVTVDQLSDGRAELGIGAGWFESEHAAYGFPFPPLRERLDELDRQLDEINRQWLVADDVWPKPVQRPRLPIIVGGLAKPRTVAAAVRHADEYNTWAPTLDEARERKAIVDAAAVEAGREPLPFSIMISCVVGETRAVLDERLAARRDFTSAVDADGISGTVDEIVEQLRAFAAIGVERAMLQHLMHWDLEMIDLLGRVAAEVADA